MAEEERLLDKAVTARIIKILQALEEETYVIQVDLPADSTCTMVKALRFAKGKGDELSFHIQPHLVPKGVVLTKTSLANSKFSKDMTARLQAEKKIAEQLDVIQSVGSFLTTAADSFAKKEGKGNAESITEVAELLQLKVPELVDKRAKLIKQKKDLTEDAKCLDHDTLLVRVHHNGVGGTIQLAIKTTHPWKSTVLSEYRYTTSPTRSGSFQQYLLWTNPLCHVIDTDADMYMCAKVPNFGIPKIQKAQVRVSKGRIQLRNLKLVEPSALPQHVPVCQLNKLTLKPGKNLLPIRVSSNPLRIRMEAFPEEEPGIVYAFGEIFNEWNQVLPATSVQVYRDNYFAHTHLTADMEIGKKVFIPCGIEPSLSVELSTETERGGESEKLATRMAFLNFTHTVTVTSTQKDRCAVRVRLQLPQIVPGSSDDPTAKVIPLEKDYKAEQMEDFVDPDMDTSTIHTVNNDSIAILRIVVPGSESSSTASFSYRIQWQDSVVTSNTEGFAFKSPFGMGAPAPVGFGAAPAPAEGLFGAPTADASGASPFGARQSECEQEVQKAAAQPLPANNDNVGGKNKQQQQQQQQQQDSWVEAGSVPASKKYSQQSNTRFSG